MKAKLVPSGPMAIRKIGLPGLVVSCRCCMAAFIKSWLWRGGGRGVARSRERMKSRIGDSFRAHKQKGLKNKLASHPQIQR